uniref:Large ribosomal subunit protein mL53 n=1 Tax=Anser brachyrhynchus TaxID=132585 RepID=A0A8B9I4Z6_9AVES
MSSCSNQILKYLPDVYCNFYRPCTQYIFKYIFRKFLECISRKKIQATNRNCEVTADVRHDGSEPLVDVMFADGDRLIMKGANLTTVEMLTALGSRCNTKELKAEQKSKKNP